MKRIVVPYALAERLDALVDPGAAEDVVVVARGPAGATVARIGEQLAARVAHADEPVLIRSGDSTTALAVVAGLQRRGLQPGVVWISARAGFDTPRTTRRGDLSAMALAMLCGRAGYALADAVGLRTVDGQRCVAAGTRELDAREREALEAAGVRRVALDDLATAPLPPVPWYVHVDLDVIDPAQLPALNFPVPGGPAAATVAAALRALASRGAIAAAGIACTLTRAGLADPPAAAVVRTLAAALE